MKSFSSVKLKITAHNSAKQEIMDNTLFSVQDTVYYTMCNWPALATIRHELGDHLRLIGRSSSYETDSI